MQPDRKLLICFLAVLGAILLVLTLLPLSSRWWREGKFEVQARSRINPDKLQAWAVDLIQRHPPQRGFYIDLLGTNLPPGMAGIKGYPPMVSIVTGDEKVPRVVLFGALGDPAILAGPTNFVTSASGTSLWKPGIYFRKPRQ